MAQLNSLIVTGNSRFLNPINGNARNGVYYVKGTQTAATGAWTGNIPVPALYDGLTIMYYLPYAGSGNATLNLTLSNGTTTGAINCYYNTGRLTTHYGKGCNIVMTYHPAGSISVDGTATTDNRWVANANYADGDSNAYQVRDYYNRYVAGANKIFPYTIIMQNSDGRWESIVTSSSLDTSKVRNTHGFRLGQVNLMYASSTYAENAILGDGAVFHAYTSGLVDHRYSFNTANNSTSGTTANRPVYLVGALNASDGLFYLDTTWWTQTLPTTADGKLYIYIGDAYDYYRMSFVIYNPIYVYTNGKVREFTQDSATVTGHTVAKDVPSNAEFTDTQSDWNATSGKAVILNKPTIPTVNNGTLTIQKNGTQVATFAANQSGNSTANITVPTVTDTYSSTGTDATSGKAVAAALGTLDGTVSGTAGSSKTLTAFSQTDGKVSATFGNISITKSQVSDFPSLGTAAAKNYTTSVTSGSSDLVTSGAVYTAIDNLPEPMVFKGSLGTDGTITALPVDGTATIGDTYKVITAGTYASKSAKVGDTFICLTKTSSANTWELIPSGDEPSGTVTSVTIKATSPIAIDSSSAITTSGTRTLSHANSGVTAGTYKSVTVNATGHVTGGTNPTTLSGYGITDAKIASGVITLGSSTITPLTASSTLDATKLSGTIPSGCYTDTNTTYSMTRDGANVKLTPSSGSAQSVGLSDLINGLGEGTSPAQGDDYLVAQYAGGGTTTTTYHRRAVKNIVNATNVKTALGTDSSTTNKFLNKKGEWASISVPTSAGSATTGISIADHSTGSITGVQSTTTTASKVTLGTAISVPNVTSAGSASNWVFEDITVPKAASSATSIPNVTAAGSGSFTQGTFDGGSGSFSATVTNGVLSFSHTHTAATHGADSHTHTAPTLGTAISVTGVSGSTTASHVKSGGNGTAPTLGTAISIPNVTGASDVTVPIKNTSATTVVTSKTHTVTDNGHTHTLS